MIFRSSPKSQSGNIFFALFGAVALVGILAAAATSFMKGPLATSVKLTKMNSAETQMSVGAQIAVMASANQANSGDCDLDGFVEPIEWRDAGASPKPTNGGLIPMTVGISKKDPWGTEYGYCVWNHGTKTSLNGCNANLLAGTNSKAYQVAALVSAGPDKAFTTTCRTFATADANSDGDLLDAGDSPLISKAAETDDDIIFSYTYDEATGASGGLWSIKSGDPNTAVINKAIETTGTASLQGGLLLPDTSLITCDPSNAGVMAMNGNAIEICDGTAWSAITGGVAGGGLVLSPNVSSGMNVTAGCGTATCYSSNVTFTLTNNISPAAASVVLATSLSNTTNFEFVSDGCNGLSLAAGASCNIVVRAKASGNVSYSGSLQILGNNSPLAMLDGTGSGFAGCNAGGMAPGGYYVACGVGGYDLVITPSGCSGGMTNPTCGGGTDTLQMNGSSMSSANLGLVASPGSGIQAAADLIAYSGGSLTFPAAAWCDGLQYQGFDDWFLPHTSELVSYFYPNKALVGSAASGWYWSSRLGDLAYGNIYYMNIFTGGISDGSFSHNMFVRCMRWTPARTVAPTVDTTPASVTFNPSYGGATETRTSNAVTVYGLTQTVAISVSGNGSPQYSINGGAYTSAAGTVSNGQQITLRATSPAAGLENVITLTVGSASFNWQVRTPGNNTIRVFTTSTTTTGALGGAGGADAFCTSLASSAGLPGSWTAVVGTGAGGDFSLNSRLPWNWTVLKNRNGVGATVAVSLADFLDGSISAPMNYSESGAVVTSTIWTGMTTTGATAGNCASWTIASSSGNNYGDSSVTTGGGYFNVNAGNCGGSYRLLCMETNAAGADLDPNPVQIRPQVTFSSGGTGTSNTVTVTGVTDEVTVTITPSAGTADIIKDGIPVGATTTTAGLNQTLAFTLTGPATLGTKNTANITIGPDAYTWWVGYADSSVQIKAFVAPISSGNMGGLVGADNICRSVAAGSSVGLPGAWKAILSDSATDAANRVPWNWGIMKSADGAVTIVDGGYNDLFDGSLDNGIGHDRNGNVYGGGPDIWTGSTSSGMRYYTDGNPTRFCVNWTDGSNYGGGMVSGMVNSAASNWLFNSSGQWCGGGYGDAIYCMEDPDVALDTNPNSFTMPYAIQVAASSRQTSEARVISGMSSGATQTLSVSATGGNPKFKVNGGAEVSSASVQNGDSVVFLMDAPASDNSSNKMTITAGTMTTYWRVWTGEASGTVIKRVFVTSATYNGNSGGLGGADAKCTAAASAAGLGGSWKAIISGTIENEYAVNRVGYNWSALYLVDGTTMVTSTGGLWNTGTTPLNNPITKTQSGSNLFGAEVSSNTNRFGFAYDTSTTSMSSCQVWSVSGNSGMHRGFNSNVTQQWIDYVQNYAGDHCGSGVRFYCIEQ